VMSTLQSLLFGMVEGLTEFVPVSSTGHMLLLQRILGIPASAGLFSYLVLVQLGAIAALLAYFWRDLVPLVLAFFVRPFSTPMSRAAWFIMLATLPALLVGALLKDAVQSLFGNPLTEAAIRFLTAAAVLAIAETFGRRRRSLESMTWRDSIIVGLFQVLAVYPGASRSGAAIAGGLLRNFDRPAATRFAFLMSAPVMLAAGAYEALGVIRDGSAGSILPALPWGLLGAVVFGWLSIRWMVSYVSHHSLYTFAAYCGALGMLCLGLAWI